MYVRLVRTILLLSLAGISVQGYSQSTPAKLAEVGGEKTDRNPVRLHGTVNILMANANGIVVVTDSRLSSGSAAVGEGRKLFRVDDHTVCTIAGWYSSAGPVIDGKYYRASVSIPDVINRYLADAEGDLSRRPISDKIVRLAEIFKFVLNVIGSIDYEAGYPPNLAVSELSLASMEASHPVLAHIVVRPHSVRGRAVYEVDNPTVMTVSKDLVYLVAGITSTAQPILESPHAHPLASPILQYYSESVAKNNGRTLSIEDMAQISRKLEFLTSQANQNYVGGPIQFATITEHGLELEQPLPVSTTGDFIPRVFVDIRGGESSLHSGSAYLMEGPTYAFIHKVRVFKSGQELNNIFFYDSEFNQCKFKYSGSDNFVLDRSNRIIDSDLVISGVGDPNSPSILQIRRDFPQLRVSWNKEIPK